jgi:hypothetical protein
LQIAPRLVGKNGQSERQPGKIFPVDRQAESNR